MQKVCCLLSESLHSCAVQWPPSLKLVRLSVAGTMQKTRSCKPCGTVGGISVTARISTLVYGCQAFGLRAFDSKGMALGLGTCGSAKQSSLEQGNCRPDIFK